MFLKTVYDQNLVFLDLGDSRWSKDSKNKQNIWLS